MACKFHNKPMPMLTWDGEGDFEDYLGLTRKEFEAAKLAYRQGGFKRWAPAYHDELFALVKAQNACTVLHMPFELWMTTTRPYLRLDSIDPDTQFWLKNKGVNWDHLLYDEHKYLRLAEIVGPERIALVLEDIPDYVHEAVTATKAEADYYCPSRPHNVNFEMRGGTLKASSIVETIKNWYEESDHDHAE